MFEGLKKKLSSFANRLAKKEEENIEKEQVAEENHINEQPHAVKAIEPKPEVQPPTQKSTGQKIEEKRAHINTQTNEPTPQAINPPPKINPIHEDVHIQKHEESVAAAGEQQKVKAVHIQAAEPINIRKEQPKATASTKLKGIFLHEIKVKDEDIEPFIEDLRMSLLQSDVNYNAAEKILDGIKSGLVDKKISSRDIDRQINEVIRTSIMVILKSKSNIDLVKMAKEKKASGGTPFKILFIGPNGAGKTTTMAKLAHMFIKNGFTCVLSASDTFRAAAIEQTVIHAQRLGVNVIKGTYGADPASVAFDSIAHAKAHSIDVVLIDSAGRQETNKSLMDEVKKMVRVAKPDIKVFVGESIAGNTLLNQVHEFNAAIGLDGVILTKLDCDAKGGNTLSIISEADVPVIYFGLGEKYDDLMPYNPDFILNNIVQAG